MRRKYDIICKKASSAAKEAQKMYRYVLFDLDGTLTDPGVGITNSVMHALTAYGITVGDRSELYSFIGPPLDESFMKYFGFKKEECPALITNSESIFTIGAYSRTKSTPECPKCSKN